MMGLPRRFSRLFFFYIKDSVLHKRGITVEHLAGELESREFIKILPDRKYLELVKKFDPKHKDELKVILEIKK